MADILDLIDAFSTPLKAAWVLWLACGTVFVIAWRRQRLAALPAPAPHVDTTPVHETAELDTAIAPEPLVALVIAEAHDMAADTVPAATEAAPAAAPIPPEPAPGQAMAPASIHAPEADPAVREFEAALKSEEPAEASSRQKRSEKRKNRRARRANRANGSAASAA